jgi:mycofactocin precursor
MTERTTDVQGAMSLAPGEDAGGDDESLLEDELLVEDVSIDGMCGVY